LIIFGIDPGTLITGYGVILVENGSIKALDYGCIKPPATYRLSDRYLVIYKALDELMDRYNPYAVSLESQFVGKNVQSAIKLGMAKGIALIVAKKKGIKVFEHTPTKVKSAVVGRGSASKSQVQGMVKALLNLPKEPPVDAADALAIAICQANSMRLKESIIEEL